MDWDLTSFDHQKTEDLKNSYLTLQRDEDLLFIKVDDNQAPFFIKTVLMPKPRPQLL